MIPLTLLCLLLAGSCTATGPEAGQNPDSAPPPGTGPLSLLAINVGKADCLLLRSGDTAYLIDTGTKDSVEQVLKVLASEQVTRLTGVIVTHTDSDHAGGLKSLVSSGLEIEAVYASAYYNKEDESKHPAVKAVKKTDLEVVFLSAGDELPLDGGTLRVIGPISHDTEKENNNSLVMLASGGGGTMLLAGDMEFPEEAELLAAGAVSPVDVLKVGNHGEGDATSDALIAALKPAVAVISTNTEEEPDTPDPRVIRLLSRWNVAVYQTQEAENGVVVTLENGEIQVNYI